jgi:hypothetical protein
MTLSFGEWGTLTGCSLIAMSTRSDLRLIDEQNIHTYYIVFTRNNIVTLLVEVKILTLKYGSGQTKSYMPE